MKASPLFIFLAAALVATAVLPGISTADTGYTSVFSGYVSDGDIRSVSGSTIIFGIPANGSSVRVVVQHPAYTTQNVTISQGNSFTTSDWLVVSVVTLDGAAQKAYIDISKPVTTATPTPTGTKIYCDTPGQLALAGDMVIFPVVIQNYDGDRTYTLSASAEAGWTTTYQYNNRDIYQIFVPAGQSRTVNLLVKTAYASAIGTKAVTASADGYSIGLSVQITSVNSSVAMSARVSTVIASIGSSASFDLTLENLQSQDNDYRLSVTGLPEGWYYRYRESGQSTGEMAEVIVPAGTTKSLVLQIVPLLSATEGDYTFTAVVTTPDGVNMTKGLTVRLKGSVSMSVASDRLAYDAKPGEALSYKVYVTNNGKGEALTGVYADVSAPSGWTVSAEPESITSIKAGETQVFTVTVVPPGNIVASDYSVEVTIKSDQQESSQAYRITITTGSYVPYIAVALVLAVVAGLGIIYRKYGRR
ncbi:MAG: NPCBM-associated, NEW3 domain of alpha-galactosidase [Methanocella sp. PtaU1.Bin125]|nr:MAG: NPCBM-associated, NEW3 domain of alpha-galactosidase [Methanocella sp. PtaU1.Bin125]